MLTTKQVVKAIKAKFGVDVAMYKGDGYYYFEGDCVDGCQSTSVYVNTLNQLSLEHWLHDFSFMLEKR